MLSKNLPHRDEYIKKRRKQKIIKYSAFFGFFLVIIGVASFISHRPQLRIQNITMTGEVLLVEEEVVLKAKQFLSGKYFFLFPKNNIFWYKRGELKVFLKDFFKRIDTIDVNLEGGNNLSIDITERKPSALWCFDRLLEDNLEDCYFMDVNGTIFSQAPTFSGNAYLKYYGLIDDSPIGKEYLTSVDFKTITAFIENVETNSVHPLYFKAKTKDNFSLVLFGGTEIYFDNQVPLDTLAENFKALLKTPELKPAKDGSIPAEYIDLRFGNKLFYKLRITNGAN